MLTIRTFCLSKIRKIETAARLITAKTLGSDDIPLVSSPRIAKHTYLNAIFCPFEVRALA
jgi:hypothetical protein